MNRAAMLSGSFHPNKVTEATELSRLPSSPPIRSERQYPG